LEKVAAEPLIGLCRREYREFHRNLNRIFAPVGVKPRFAVECDTTSSVFLEVEAGRGIALCMPILKLVTGKRLVYRLVTGTTELASIGIARATKGAVTPAVEKFCEILRTTLDGAKAKRSSETGHTSNGRAMRVPKPVDASVISRPSYYWKTRNTL
jgi:DNA-binding transcriptional LysR family regulator